MKCCQAAREAAMFEATCRRTILLASIVLASMAPRPAGAQDPFRLPGDLLLLKARELEVKYDEARLQDDINRGDAAGMSRDLQSIRRHERGVERVRRWVRRDVFLPLGFYPLPPPSPPVPPTPSLIAHPQYPGYGYFPSDPNHLYRLSPLVPVTSAGISGDASTVRVPAVTAAHNLIEIVNTGPPGTNVDYFINGVAYRIEGGGRQKLDVGPRSTVAYDRGSRVGKQRYSLSAGVYEFRPRDSGWALFKLSPNR
jgi:hypothetical protein